MKSSLAEKTNSLMLATAQRRDLTDRLAAMKLYKDRALIAEKQVSELTDDNQKLKVQLDFSHQKASAFKDESEAHKEELYKQSDLLKTKENTISHLNIALDVKQKQIDAQTEELKRQRKLAEETEVEARRNRLNEETSMKRLKRKDEENLSLRKEVTGLKKALSETEMKLSKLDVKFQFLQEHLKSAHTEKTGLLKEKRILEHSLANYEKEIIETQTVLQKFQQDNKFLKDQVEQLKAKLADEIRSSKKNKIKFEKDLLQKQEEYTKLKTQTEDTLAKNRRATEAIFYSERKTGILADTIREQECKIIELSKEVLRLHENEQKFKMVKETYSKVERLWMDEDKGDLIILPDDDTKNEKLRMYRSEIHRLSTKLKEKEGEIKDLKLEEEKLQQVLKNLKCKLDLLPEDTLHRVQESQITAKALRRQIKALEKEISVLLTKIKTQEDNITGLKNKISDISFSQKDKIPPIQSNNIKLKSEDTDPKPTKSQNIIYLPPIHITSCGKTKSKYLHRRSK
ncbi:spindle pole body component 110-like [Poecilia latipinna]|uniref:spindle pole body component 110-like n=1 Tax=Poecilia latipinna TaxID=48699 RepID=UPI00072DBDE4|nr:PREDICTED: spindle pole body component 110-like [Poecilia latipinna]